MCALLTVTYRNFMVVYNAGQLALFWYVPVIFIMNIITIIIAFYKFTSFFFENSDKKEW